jgi:hypothetical protein
MKWLPTRTAREKYGHHQRHTMPGFWLGVLALFVPVVAALIAPVLNQVGAVGTYGITKIADVNTVWRIVQAPLQVAANFMVPEWDRLGEIPEFNIDWSGRQIIVPLDLQDDLGVASIPEGGYEARPSSVKPTDGQVSWILLNARITISKTSRWIDQRNRNAMLERQLLYQGRKKLQAMARRLAEYLYGFSTGVMAKVTSLAGAVATIKDQYGVAGLGSTTAPFVVQNAFKVGDYVAFLDPAGPALRDIEKITAVTPATPSITLENAPAGVVANDLIVFANSLENTTLAGGTDYNAALVGFLDICESATVHNVATSAEPKWAAGRDTTGGRLTGVRLIKAQHAIEDNGGGSLRRVLMDRGVERDFIAYLQAAVRFSNPYAMVVDGRPRMEGVTFESTRFVPEGYTFCYDDQSAHKKMTLLPKPGQLAWDDAKELIDQSGYVLALDYPCQSVVVNRASFFEFTGLSRQ